MSSKSPLSRVQPNLLRKLNERLVIDALQRNGPCSRADLTRQMGISPPTASKTVASLMSVGLIEEVESQHVSLGRPGKLLRFSSKQMQVVGVVMDARRCWIGFSSFEGNISPEHSLSFPTPGTYAALIDALEDGVKQLLQQCDSIIGIGISVPGLTNSFEQKTVFSPNLHMTDGQSPGQDLSERLGVQCIVLQEMHALALGERAFGAAQGLNDFAIIDITTGVGLGVFSGGRLIEGHRGMAGELGHLTVDLKGKLCGCGNHGCIETVACDAAFLDHVSENFGEQLDWGSLTDAIRSGRLQPTAEIKQYAEYLSIALSAVINIYNPSHLFVHGQIFDFIDDFCEQVRQLTRNRTLGPPFEACELVPARGNKELGAIAGMIEYYMDTLAPVLDK
ncbi:N-acetylglucosamine repressor [Polystyrenella longa]|uniref:N-acetylglucosamine repressor n=1 Tax=Polystyrenella longa TaxID=2528007 RepID=A0A518CM11_9PLAN|nr:ROK family transcriptional regulator [Polystyrenella longa]QDU80271.1 N-acetylglucosamine repressor [Polystyrenella longa]